MAKKFEISEEERKLLEGSEAGKLMLKKLEQTAADVEKAMLDSDAKVSSAEKARKDLEDSLLNPDILEAITSRRKPAPEPEENLDELPPSKLAAKLRKEQEDREAKLTGLFSKKLDELVTGVAAAFNTLQLEALEDKHGQDYVSRKEKLVEFASKVENRGLRPRHVYSKFRDAEELEAKRQADAAAKAAEVARQKELESFTENPESTIAPSATQDKDVALSPDEMFEKAWKRTPGAEKLLKQE